MKKLVVENIEGILKPKSDKEIVDHFTQEIMLEMLEGSAVSFFKRWDTNIPAKRVFNVFKSPWNINEQFDKLYEKHGPGLYLATNFYNIFKIPLEHIFQHKVINKIIIYNVSPSKQDFAIKELVAKAYINDEIGNGFHIKYFGYEKNKKI